MVDLFVFQCILIDHQEIMEFIFVYYTSLSNYNNLLNNKIINGLCFMASYAFQMFFNNNMTAMMTQIIIFISICHI